MRSIAALLIAAGLCTGCSESCANVEASRLPAPDGRREAVVFQRDCGATTGFSTQVSIILAGERPKAAGNVFVADADEDVGTRSAWGGPWAEVVWLDDRRLLVRYDSRSRVFKRVDEALGVRITYQPVAR